MPKKLDYEKLVNEIKTMIYGHRGCQTKCTLRDDLKGIIRHAEGRPCPARPQKKSILR